MTKSELFKAAHKLTRKTRTTNDSYSATFSLCLKYIYKYGIDNDTQEKEYKLYIPYAEKKDRKRAKNYLAAKWNPNGKYWVVFASMSEIRECNLHGYLQKKENKINAPERSNKVMSYSEAFDKYGFDFAEEGNYTGI